MKLYSKILYTVMDNQVCERAKVPTVETPDISEAMAFDDANPLFSTPEYLQTRHYIQQKLWNRLFSKYCKEDFLQKMAYIFVLCYSIRMENSPSVYTKYQFISKLFSNPMYSETIQENVMELVQKSQRTYFAFVKLARLFRVKTYKVQIDTDLYMNELSPKNRKTFVLLDNRSLYYFSISDLTHIIHDALTYSYIFDSIPLTAKNPYNNTPFSLSALYNIYFHMLHTLYVVPKFIRLFFESDFNIYRFKWDNEPELREHIVREYVSKMDSSLSKSEIKQMLRLYDVKKQINIDPEFPADVLVKAMKPYITLYYLVKYTSDTIRRQHYRFKLKYSLCQFIQLNPTFGRRIAHANTGNDIRGLPKEKFHYITKVNLPRKMPSQEKVAAHIYDDNIYNRYILYGVLGAEDIPFRLYELGHESESESEAEAEAEPIQNMDPPPPPSTHEPEEESEIDDSSINSDEEVNHEDPALIYDSDVSSSDEEETEDDD